MRDTPLPAAAMHNVTMREVWSRGSDDGRQRRERIGFGHEGPMAWSSMWISWLVTASGPVSPGHIGTYRIGGGV